MGKNGPQSSSLTGFLLFFVTRHAARDVTRCHAICIFFTRGTHIWKGRGCSSEILKNPFKETNLGVGHLFFWPLKETILLQCSLVIGVIENFDYMNWVNKTNWLFNNYSSSPNGLWVNSLWGRRPHGLLTLRPIRARGIIVITSWSKKSRIKKKLAT